MKDRSKQIADVVQKRTVMPYGLPYGIMVKQSKCR
jgi:hypothetical protein